MSEAKFVFVFDTNLFWALFENEKESIVEDIVEIFNYSQNIEYIAPKNILNELSGKHRDKLPYLQHHLQFEQNQITDEDISYLIEKNQTSDQKYFEWEEKEDYKIIQTAINYDTKEKVTAIVTNDEGFHNFLLEEIPESGIKAIWVHSFLSFLARQAVEKGSQDKLRQTAEILEKYVDTFRTKQSRAIIPIKDFERVLIASTIQSEITEDIQQNFDDYVIMGFCATDLPKHLAEVAEFIGKIMSYLDVQNSALVEEELEKLENDVMDLTIKERENVERLIAPHMITIFTKLAGIYDQEGAQSAVISALERTKYHIKYIQDYTEQSQLYAILSWVHLLNNSETLAKYYYKKVKDTSFHLALRTRAFMTLYDTPSEDIGESLLELLPYETWQDMKNTVLICANQRLRNKLEYLLLRFSEPPSFVFDVRHFSIKNMKITEETKLSFLQKDFMIVHKEVKEKYILLRATNKHIGEVEIRTPILSRVQKTSKGEIIQFEDAIIEKISKPMPGEKIKARIYISEVNDNQIQISKKQRIV